MEQKQLDALKASAQAAAGGGKPVDPNAVLALVDHHESIVRSEAFWGNRGPKLADEVQALRSIEPHARALLAHGKTLASTFEAAESALSVLDGLRAVGKVAG